MGGARARVPSERTSRAPRTSSTDRSTTRSSDVGSPRRRWCIGSAARGRRRDGRRVDVVENYAPSNAGRWTQNLALFLGAAVKHLRKARARRRGAPSAAVRDRFGRRRRVWWIRMYSKNATLRRGGVGGTARLRSPRRDASARHATILRGGGSRHGHAPTRGGALRAHHVRPADVVAPPRRRGGTRTRRIPRRPDATLPGIDANDPANSGHDSSIRGRVSNLGTLADPGDEGERAVPLRGPRIDRFPDGSPFRNVDPGKADGADKHRGGAGGDGGASYLMGSSSMYSR